MKKDILQFLSCSSAFRYFCISLFVLNNLYLPAYAGTHALSYEEQTLTLKGKERTVRVPKGYTLEFLSEFESPRMLTFAPNGDLFAGSKSGKVFRLPPPYTNAEVLVKMGNYPHSVAFRKNEILIALTDGVYQAPYQSGQKEIEKKSVTLLAALPKGGGHNSRSVGVGPDKRVYVSLGIQRNCSDQYLGPGYRFDDWRGGVLVLRESHGKAIWKPFASGLRNPVGFDWQPQTGALYASNNGPDHWGFDQPPEYFSKLKNGSFHGMPWYQFDGKQIQRDDCIKKAAPRAKRDVSKPEATFDARSAPLGMAFVPRKAMDRNLEFDAAVALHGSWATQPYGDMHGHAYTRREPKVVLVRFHKGKAVRVDDLITGFQLANGDRWARPTGVAFGPDGDLYFSSDSELNGIFRLHRVH